jgi:hypothetical protein
VFAGKHHDPFISCPAGPFSGSAVLETQSGEIVISGTNQNPFGKHLTSRRQCTGQPPRPASRPSGAEQRVWRLGP